MTGMTHALSRYDYLVKQCLDGKALLTEPPLAQHFGHLLGKPNEITGNLSHQAILDAYIALVDGMKTTTVTPGPAEAGMTFFGQFVDHDITLDATSSIGRKIDPRSIRNVRTPTLDLDCVYGDGPDASPHLYHNKHKDYLLFGRDDCPLDLARNAKGTALIGDPRNDENILVSQIQGAFICLHNILMSHAKDGARAENEVSRMVHGVGGMSIRKTVWTETVVPRLMDFEHVRRTVRLHYQWLVLNQLLPSFVDKACIKAALAAPYVFGKHGPIMPAEFSGAAYRFGHATVQPSYKLRADEQPRDLFAMMKAFSPRVPDDDMHMNMFFDLEDGNVQMALPVGTKMAGTLFALPDGIVNKSEKWGEIEVPVAEAKKLALRNILRDRTALQLASGQQVARWLHAHAPHLGIKELKAPEALSSRHIDKTPLWFYCLQEADAGGKLTGVGGTIVAQVFVRLLRLDPESILNTDFTPWEGFGGADMTMGKMMKWIETNRDTIPLGHELRCG